MEVIAIGEAEGYRYTIVRRSCETYAIVSPEPDGLGYDLYVHFNQEGVYRAIGPMRPIFDVRGDPLWGLGRAPAYLLAVDEADGTEPML